MSLLDSRSVHRAREELFETGTVSDRLATAVRPEILASWRRSAAFGAQSQAPTLPYNDRSAAAEHLVMAAEPVLRSLAERLAGLNAGVLLADREANIVKRWVTESDIARDLDRISSDCGFGAPEDRIGTNGIGTVAELGKPQMIVGPEHYADSLLSFTCVGAPIHNPITKRLSGIVTLSCSADAANTLLTPLLAGAASDIENRLLESSSMAERRLLRAYLDAKKRHRVVVALNRDILMAGPRGNRALSNLAARDDLWNVALGCVDSSPVAIVLDQVDGRQTAVQLSPVRSHDRLVGVVVVFDPATVDQVEIPSHQSRPARGVDVGWLEQELPGSSPRWRSTLQLAAGYVANRTAVVIEGPRGSGKWTLARRMTERRGPAASVVAVDAAELVEERCRASLAAIEETPDVLLIRHADQFDHAGAVAMSELFDRFAHLPWVVATRTSHDSTSDAGRRVLERLDFAALEMPSLADRADDIPAIVKQLTARHPNGGRVHLSSDAVSELRRASWPGEVRQLTELVHSLLASRIGEVGIDDLPIAVRSSAMQRYLSQIEQLECEAIIRALRDANGNKQMAAKTLGLSRSTIYRKIRAFGIDCETTFF
jgi:sigma-54 dependent transcriptional regulator, acetoin dehydrogenase operon transcriptional activator AcoR